MNHQLSASFLIPLAIAVGSVANTVQAEEPVQLTAAQAEFFEAKIRPILVQHCYECHARDSDDVGGKLLVDSREGLLNGGETGPAVVPGDPRKSLLLSALEYQDLEMPPEARLPDDVIADFRRWIRMGAPDPRGNEQPMPKEAPTSADPTPLWSLNPVTRPAVPTAGDANWPRSDIDRFVQARREQHQLLPTGDARPATLLRRVSMDLAGLPPTPQELAAFEADPSSEHFQQIVDRLLASPRFGERWGRHWLDVVRYGESAGNSRDVLIPYAYRYRDYVIDAFNNDIPFDRFVTEQLAGDLLTADSPAERDRLVIATGLLAVGSKSLNGGNVDLDLVDDQIDVIGKSMIGLTISCARCHDHKFDPIPTADYYALAGIFKSTETFYGGGTNRPKTTADQLKVYLPLGPLADQKIQQITTHNQKLAKLNKQIADDTKKSKQLSKGLPQDWRAEKNRLERLLAESPPPAGLESNDSQLDESKRDQSNTKHTSATGSDVKAGDSTSRLARLSPKDRKLFNQITAFEQVRTALADARVQLETLQAAPVPSVEFAVGVRDANKIASSPIHIRGERTKTGEVVRRGFLSCVTTAETPVIAGNKTSGRLQLARWLTQPDHPLTARVYVNRIWMHLFGRGIVETVDNFGVNGREPSHPLLLDYLAHRFVNVHDWSTKALIRELVLTRTYQLSSDYAAEAYTEDPANELYWRMSRRRLEAEVIRDSMLLASGNLVLDRPEQSLVTRIGEGEVGRGIDTSVLQKPFPHRSVYLPIIRGLIPEFLKVFDLPEPSNPQGQRDATNVPAQALFLMNSPFVIEQATDFAGRVYDGASDDATRIQLAFQIAVSRQPGPDELAEMQAFLVRMRTVLEEEQPNAEQREQLSWTLLCQSLFGSAEFRYLE